MSIQVCEKLIRANTLIQTAGAQIGSVTSRKTAAKMLMDNAAHINESVRGLGVLKNEDLIDLKARVLLISKQFKSLADNVRSGRWGKPELSSKLSSITTESRALKKDISKVQEYIEHSDEIANKQADAEYEAELKEFKRTQELRAKNGLSTEVDDSGKAIQAPVRKIRQDDGREAAARSSVLIGGYATKFKDKIPNRIKILHVDTLPIYVKFGNSRVTMERLNNLGIKAEPLSTINVGSTDIGICLEDQVIGFFKASDADKFNANYYSVQERDRRTNITVLKNLKRNITKANREIEKLKVEARTLNKAIPEERKQLVSLSKQKRAIEDKIAGYNQHIAKLEGTDKKEKSTLNAIKRSDSKTRDTTVAAYAEHLVSLINQKAQPELSLVTATFMHRLGNGGDLVAMWLMPKHQYVRLLELASTGLNVKHWNWPWAL